MTPKELSARTRYFAQQVEEAIATDRSNFPDPLSAGFAMAMAIECLEDTMLCKGMMPGVVQTQIWASAVRLAAIISRIGTELSYDIAEESIH